MTIHKAVGYWEFPRERWISEGTLCGLVGVESTENISDVTCERCLEMLDKEETVSDDVL